MRKYPLILMACLLSAGLVHAQDITEFMADRPGATTGPSILPAGRVQWETGFATERSALEGPWSTTWTVNTSLFRVGLSKFAELRVQAEYLIHNSHDGVKNYGFDNIMFGVKAKMVEGNGWIPDMALMANAFIPGQKTSPFMSDKWGGQIALLCEHTVTSWFSVGYEADLIWEGEEVEPDAFFGICLGFKPWKRISVYVEEFNRSTARGLKSWTELSLAFQLAPRVQLDIATDISLNNPSKYSILMLGVIWQITRR